MLFMVITIAYNSTANSEPYIGAGIGVSTYSSTCSNTSTSCKESTAVYKLLAGYTLPYNFAIESAYHDLGSPTATFTDRTIDVAINGVEISIRKKLPLTEQEQAFVYGKAGGLLWKAQNTDEKSGASPLLSLGGEYFFTPSLSINAEYQWADDIKYVGESDMHLFTLGLNYFFNQSEGIPAISQPNLLVEPEHERIFIKEYKEIISSEKNDLVMFKSGSHQLTDFMKSRLQNILLRLKKYPQSTLEIIGHTDNIGTAESNMTLSISRARSVANYLKFQGINKDRFTITGKGEHWPKASNRTAEGRMLNRRVELISPSFSL